MSGWRGRRRTRPWCSPSAWSLSRACRAVAGHRLRADWCGARGAVVDRRVASAAATRWPWVWWRWPRSSRTGRCCTGPVRSCWCSSSRSTRSSTRDTWRCPSGSVPRSVVAFAVADSDTRRERGDAAERRVGRGGHRRGDPQPARLSRRGAGPGGRRRAARRGGGPAPGHRGAAAHRPRTARRARSPPLADQRAGQCRAAPPGSGPVDAGAHRDQAGEPARRCRSCARRSGSCGTTGRPTAPGLDGLDDLVTTAGRSGLEIRAELAETRPLPPEVDLAAFRIVQEALTNVTRHAGATAAVVRVRPDRDAVVIEIEDDGTGAPGPRRHRDHRHDRAGRGPGRDARHRTGPGRRLPGACPPPVAGPPA